MKKNKCRRVLAGALAVALVSMNLPASVAGELRAVAVEPAAAQELTEFSQQINALVSQDKPESYYDTLKITAGENAATADGEVIADNAAARMENGILTVSEQFLNDLMGIKPEGGASVQSNRRVPLQETAEAMGYTVIMTEDGAELKNNFQTSRLIVKAKGEIDSLGAVKTVDGFDDLHIFQYKTSAEAFAAYQTYQEMDGVEFVEPSVYVETAESDASASEDFLRKKEKEAALENMKSKVASIDGAHYSWGADKLGVDVYSAFLAQSVAKLPEVVVAVIDTGIDYEHEWFADRIADGGANFVNNGVALPQDDHGHGTHVSGTICDMTLDNVKILPIKALDEGGFGTNEQIYCAMKYANQSDAEVVNMSLGGYGYSYLFEEAVNEGTEQGIVYCIAAGNDAMSGELFSPGNIEAAVTVSAVDEYDEPAYFTNFGTNIDFAAPGVMINSAAVGGGTVEMDGTSMATPHVAGCCALLKSYDPALSVEDTVAVLATHAEDLGEPGFDEIYGYGRISMAFTDMYTEICATPVFSLENGSYEGTQTVTITAAADASVYYTTDNTTPSAENGTLYTSPLTIAESTIIRAVAVCEGKADSSVAKASYMIDGKDTANAFVVENGVLVCYNGMLDELDLNEYEETAAITAIGPSAFVGSDVAILTLPESVTLIDDCAFENSTKLTVVNGPGVVSVGDYAFSNCRALTEVNFGALQSLGEYSFMNAAISACNASGVTELPEGVFNGCFNLEDLTLGAVTTVGDNALRNCNILEVASVIQMDALVTIGAHAFEGCWCLYGTVSFDSLESIGEYALAETNISRVTFSEKVTEIPDYCLYENYGLTYVSAPGATVIGDLCFLSSDQILNGSSVEFDLSWEKITEIGMGAFVGVQFNEDITLSALETLYNESFVICVFSNISLPKLKSVPGLAFEFCEANAVILESVESFDIDSLPYAQYLVVGADCMDIQPEDATIELSAGLTAADYEDDSLIGFGSNIVIIGEPGSYAETFANENGHLFEAAPYAAEINTEYVAYQYDQTILKSDIFGFGLSYQWYMTTGAEADAAALADGTSANYLFETETPGTYTLWCAATDAATGEVIETERISVEVMEYETQEITVGQVIELRDTEKAAFTITPAESDLFYFPDSNEAIASVTVIGNGQRQKYTPNEYFEMVGGETYFILLDCSYFPLYNRFEIKSAMNQVSSITMADITYDTLMYTATPDAPVSPEFTVSLFGEVLTEGVDYEVVVYDGTTNGIDYAFICGIGAYEGCIFQPFAITEPLTLDESVEVTVYGDNIKMYSFTPETDGFYTLSSAFIDGVAYNHLDYDYSCILFDEIGDEIGWFDDSGYSLMFEAGISMTAGETYYFGIDSYCDDEAYAAPVTIRMTDETRTSLAEASVYAPDAEYTGEVVSPQMEVQLGDVTLVEDEDYIVIEDVTVTEGYATGRITGIGSYYGVVDNINYYVGDNSGYEEVIPEPIGELVIGEPMTLDWSETYDLTYSLTVPQSGYYCFEYDSIDVFGLLYVPYEEEDGTVVYGSEYIENGDCLYLWEGGTYLAQFLNYGDAETTELIVSSKLAIDEATVEVGEYFYEGEMIVPEVSVYYGEELLVQDEDYFFECPAIDAPGVYEYTIYGIGRFTGAYYGELSVGIRIDENVPEILADTRTPVEIAVPGETAFVKFTADSTNSYLISAELLNGLEIMVFDSLGIPVYDQYQQGEYLWVSSEVMFEQDMTYYIGLKFTDVSATGTVDLSVTLDYTDLFMATAEYDDTLEYTGVQQRPEVTLYDIDGNVLTEGVDYVITDSLDGVECGTHYLYIRGIGRCTGTMELCYFILPADLNAEDAIELSEGEIVEADFTDRGQLFHFTAEMKGYYMLDLYADFVANAVAFDSEMNPFPFAGDIELQEGEEVYIYVWFYEILGLDFSTAEVSMSYWGDIGGDDSDGIFSYYYDEERGGIIIDGYSNPATEYLDIPSYIDGYPVVGIEAYAFYGFDALWSVTLPEVFVEECPEFIVGDYAFAGTAMSGVVIPANYTLGVQSFGYTLAGEPVEDFTIVGYTGTNAETYANENGFIFVAMVDTMFGDLNGDALIDTDDATVILKAYADAMVSGEMSEDVLMYGDVDGSGEINSDDAVAILKVYANFMLTGEYDWSIINVG